MEFTIFKRKIVIVLFLITSYDIFCQNYENSNYQINFTNKVVGKKILDGDTLLVLEKKAGSKYVDSLKLGKLDKTIEYEYSLPDNLPDGKYTAYYNDKKQNIIFKVSYKNNKRNGAFNFYHYNGKVREIGFYENNCLDKVIVCYNSKGQLMKIFYASNCELNGSYFSFYKTGEFFNMTNYKNGKKNGILIEYDNANKKYPNVRYIFEYKDGERIMNK